MHMTVTANGGKMMTSRQKRLSGGESLNSGTVVHVHVTSDDPMYNVQVRNQSGQVTQVTQATLVT